MSVILGIDEVGRGPWAGPLVVGAVILGEKFTDLSTAHHSAQDIANTPSETGPNVHAEVSASAELIFLWNHLADSKALTAKRRTELSSLIFQYAAASATGWVSSAELDRYGLSASLKLATRRAVKQILATGAKFDEIIIDGTVNFLANTPLAGHVTTLKKADALIKEVSAASILAKVARDNYMVQLAQRYPEYGFEKHVGYGTKAHLAALQQHGVCPEHRTSFRPVREIHPRSAPKVAVQQGIGTTSTASTTARGQRAEAAVASYLGTNGHRVIARNFKTKTCEIDLISTCGDQIYFTEVKYSANPTNEGTPLVRITPRKQQQMAYAAQVFLQKHQEMSEQIAQLTPVLAAASVTGGDYTVKEWVVLV